MGINKKVMLINKSFFITGGAMAMADKYEI
jgi:hypothetical protein